MTFDILPYEIFQLVALSLGPNKHDLAECCLVCTNWLPLFVEQLYLDITICGPPSFNLFYTCLSIQSSTRYTQHRQLLIRILSIQDGNINQEQMNKLPSLCPKLEQLTIDGRAHWNHAMPSLLKKNDGQHQHQQQQQWQHQQQQQRQHQNENTETMTLTTKTNTAWWPYLKSACILATCITPTVMRNAPQLARLTLRCMYDGRLSTGLISALTQTPLLNYLSIDECASSLQQLESIHESCPLLIQLRLVHTIIDTTDHHLQIAHLPASSTAHQWNNSGNGMSPSLTLRQFVIQEATAMDDALLSDWFMYIAFKYPQLESLEWWQKSTHGIISTPQIDTSVALYLISQCRHLTSARFFNINVDPLFYRSLLEQNSQSLVPIHHHSTTSDVKEIGMNYSLNLGHCGQQLRSYLLWWNEEESPLEYVPRLPSSLVTLHLSGRMCYSSFDMNLILNQCPHLEFLHLDFGTLNQVVPAHVDQWKKVHPLKRLTMEEIKLSAVSLKLVAFRCRDLTELDLLDCILTDDDENGDIDLGDGNSGININNISSISNSTMGNDDNENNGGRNHGHLVFPFQHFEKVKLCGFRFAANPSLRAKSVGIYETDKQQPVERWYYLSHHATFISYAPVHSCRYKLPVQAIKQHCITKVLPASSSKQQQHYQHQHLLIPPTELNALRQMQRHYGKFGRDAPCAGYLTLVCKSINKLYLENKGI